MANRLRRRAGMAILAAASAAVLAAESPARAQVDQPVDTVPFFGGEGAFANQALGGMNKPVVQRQGDWAEVIMSNGRWVVLQNAQGQQFPVAFDAIRQFVVRWPTRFDLVAPDAFVEATGVNIGTNTLQTDHVDVYEGTARSLVSVGMFNLFGANRVLTPLDVEQQQIYGSVFPFSPLEAGLPARIHIVGNILNLDPLRLGAPGNNWVNVVPLPDGLNVTQVTLGTPTYVKKGDLVYYIPDSAGPKSVVVSRFILYKKVPLRAYTAGN